MTPDLHVSELADTVPSKSRANAKRLRFCVTVRVSALISAFVRTFGVRVHVATTHHLSIVWLLLLVPLTAPPVYAQDGFVSPKQSPLSLPPYPIVLSLYGDSGLFRSPSPYTLYEDTLLLGFSRDHLSSEPGRADLASYRLQVCYGLRRYIEVFASSDARTTIDVAELNIDTESRRDRRSASFSNFAIGTKLGLIELYPFGVSTRVILTLPMTDADRLSRGRQLGLASDTSVGYSISKTFIVLMSVGYAQNTYNPSARAARPASARAGLGTQVILHNGLSVKAEINYENYLIEPLVAADRRELLVGASFPVTSRLSVASGVTVSQSINGLDTSRRRTHFVFSITWDATR